MKFIDEFLNSAPPRLELFKGDGPAAIYLPVVNEIWRDHGRKCRSTMSLAEAQKAMDDNPNLTSDEYDSFWMGWNSAG